MIKSLKKKQNLLKKRNIPLKFSAQVWDLLSFCNISRDDSAIYPKIKYDKWSTNHKKKFPLDY